MAPRYKEMGIEVALPSKPRTFESLFPTKQKKLESRQMEIAEAIHEGKELMVDYGLITTIYSEKGNFSKYSDRIAKERNTLVVDPRATIDVPESVFPQLIADKKIPYVYEEMELHNNSNGSGDKNVWFITKENLRVRTTMKKENPFYHNVIFPSFVSQRLKHMETIRGRETTPEELDGLDRTEHFTALDASTLKEVRKMKILTSDQADKLKNCFPIFRILKNFTLDS